MLTKVKITTVDVKNYFCYVDYVLHFNIREIRYYDPLRY